MKIIYSIGMTLAAVLVVSGNASAAAPKLRDIASFDGAKGSTPFAGLAADAAGNLYGTTYNGGANGLGSVFELVAPAQGRTAWKRIVLTSFTGGDGSYPQAGVLLDGAGNVYGAASQGGVNGFGSLFELSPPGNAPSAWRKKVLVSFDGVTGRSPEGGLIADAQGNLYGTTVTTSGGDPAGYGTVFELSPPAHGQSAWKKTVLWTFGDSDGGYPEASLVFDNAGNLYGTTRIGGTNDKGVVFRLSPPVGQGGWTETVLASFGGENGSSPWGGLVLDKAGNLYGTTETDGYSVGTVFELSPPAQGQSGWTETVLTNFKGTNGANPYAGLIFDSTGILYGTTSVGGSSNNGTVFSLAPPARGQTTWTQTVLASFDGSNGRFSSGALVLDPAGNLFGTTEAGGKSNLGTVFEVRRKN